MFQPRVIKAVVGTEQAIDAAGAGRAMWEAAGISDYSFELEVICFCTISGRFQVTVVGGETVEVTSESGTLDLSSPDRFLDYEIEGLFALATDWNGQTPDEMIASFDPELGYPVEVRIDSMRDSVDDELTFFVGDFQVTD